MRISCSGIRFFHQRVLAWEWKILSLLHARRELPRPSVLSRVEIHRLSQAAYSFHNQVCFTTVCASITKRASASIACRHNVEFQTMSTTVPGTALVWLREAFGCDIV